MGHLGPKARGGTTVSLMIYVEDVDRAFKQAIVAGGTEERPVENQFWGDRMGTLTDPFGHKWTLATTVEEVPDSELQDRMKAWSEQQKQSEPA
jgi:PhnB protein